MKYIVYQTVNTVNNKIYIGVHKTANLDFDGYLGCGVNINLPVSYKHPKTNFLFAVKKYGVTSFIRTTLKVFDTEIDALDLERWLVDEEFVRRPDTYNMIVGGGWTNPPNAEVTYIYDKNGNFVKLVNSRTDASEFIYGDRRHSGNISRAVHYGGFCKLYLLSNIKYPYMKDYETYKRGVYKKMADTINSKYELGKVLNFANPKKIAQYDLEGNLVKIWESLNLCRKAGFTNVLAVVEGNRNTCKGYTFQYYED